MQLICRQIYILASRIVSRCRSAKEQDELQRSFRRHFDEVDANRGKALEYERIMESKDELFAAIGAVKEEARAASFDLAGAKAHIEELEHDNQQLRATLAMLCELHAKGKYVELGRAINLISKQFLPHDINAIV